MKSKIREDIGNYLKIHGEVQFEDLRNAMQEKGYSSNVIAFALAMGDSGPSMDDSPEVNVLVDKMWEFTCRHDLKSKKDYYRLRQKTDKESPIFT